MFLLFKNKLSVFYVLCFYVLLNGCVKASRFPVSNESSNSSPIQDSVEGAPHGVEIGNESLNDSLRLVSEAVSEEATSQEVPVLVIDRSEVNRGDTLSSFELSPSPVPSISPSPIPRLLKLYVIQEVDSHAIREGETYHAMGVDHAIPMDMTVGESLIQVHTKIGLRDLSSSIEKERKNLFFAWSEDFYGHKILTARYTFQIQREPGQWQGSIKPWLAWADRENQRFLIPFSELFRNIESYREGDVNLDHEQVLDLELILENGELISVKIKFQSSGPLPILVRETIPIVDSMAYLEKSRAVFDKGIVVKKEKFTNSTNRSLALWLNATEFNLGMWHFFKFPKYISTVAEGPKYVGDEVKISVGALAVDRVEAFHENKTQETIQIGPSGWASLVLLPNEALTLEWKARVAQGAQLCSIPEKVTRSWSWFQRVMFNGGGEIPATQYLQFGPIDLTKPDAQVYNGPFAKATLVHYIKDIDINWSLTKVQLIGDWKRRVRVSHLFVPGADATGVENLGFTDQVNPIRNFRQIHSKVEPHSVAQYRSIKDLPIELKANCQGFYPN